MIGLWGKVLSMSELTHTSSTEAPDFVLTDTYGEQVRLSDFRGHAHVVLVFNRGFN